MVGVGDDSRHGRVLRRFMGAYFIVTRTAQVRNRHERSALCNIIPDTS